MIQRIRLIICLCVLLSLQEIYSSNGGGRFLVPRDGVLQLAFGVAVPFRVPQKTIAANYGILINYPLPDNITELRQPIEFVRRSNHQHNFINKLLYDFGKSPFLGTFMGRAECFLENQKHLKGKLVYDFIRIIFRKLERISSEKGLKRPQLLCDSLGSYEAFANYIKQSLLI